ncbi:MAG TPA: ABC transporter permease, partial [Nitrospira sp.]|nr:ABC transporter permease [Nitrospira sp.]
MAKSTMTAWLRLAGTLIRSHGWQRPFRTVLTVAGVALGVLSFVAILTANREVLRAFERAVLTVAGPATLEVSGRDLGLDETILEVIRHSAGVQKVIPLIEEAVVLGEGTSAGESVQIYGMDLLEEAEGIGFRVERAETEDLLNDLLEPDRVFLGRQLSDELNLVPGSTFKARAGSRWMHLKVAGLLEGSDRPKSYWNRVAIMDLAAAQVLFQMVGRLDRIDIVTAPNRTPEEVAASLRAVLSPSVVVQRPTQRTAQIEKMVGAF